VPSELLAVVSCELVLSSCLHSRLLNTELLCEKSLVSVARKKKKKVEKIGLKELKINPFFLVLKWFDMLIFFIISLIMSTPLLFHSLLSSSQRKSVGFTSTSEIVRSGKQSRFFFCLRFNSSQTSTHTPPEHSLCRVQQKERMRLLLVCLLAAVAVGCVSAETHKFNEGESVSVRKKAGMRMCVRVLCFCK
jgi:hypothetical protein